MHGIVWLRLLLRWQSKNTLEAEQDMGAAEEWLLNMDVDHPPDTPTPLA